MFWFWIWCYWLLTSWICSLSHCQRSLLTRPLCHPPCPHRAPPVPLCMYRPGVPGVGVSMMLRRAHRKERKEPLHTDKNYVLNCIIKEVKCRGILLLKALGSAKSVCFIQKLMNNQFLARSPPGLCPMALKTPHRLCPPAKRNPGYAHGYDMLPHQMTFNSNFNECMK